MDVSGGRFHVSSTSDVIRRAGLQKFVQFEGVITGLSQPQKYTQVFHPCTEFACLHSCLLLVIYCMRLEPCGSNYEKYIICVTSDRRLIQ